MTVHTSADLGFMDVRRLRRNRVAALAAVPVFAATVIVATSPLPGASETPQAGATASTTSTVLAVARTSEPSSTTTTTWPDGLVEHRVAVMGLGFVDVVSDGPELAVVAIDLHEGWSGEATVVDDVLLLEVTDGSTVVRSRVVRDDAGDVIVQVDEIVEP